MPGILIVSADFPHPVDTGKKLVLNGFLQYFSDRYKSENVTWLLIGSYGDENTQYINSSGIKVRCLPLPHLLKRLSSLILYSVMLRSKSLQESMFYSSTVQFQIEQQIDLINPDVIVFDTIRMGQFLPSRFASKSILYLEDLFSIRYDRMLEQLELGRSFGSTVLGNFARFIPRIICAQINSSQFIQSLLLDFEKQLVAKSERKQSKLFKGSLLLNKDEVEELKKHSNDADIQFIPPFLGVPENPERNYHGNATFIYLGALQYPPNEAGLLEFFTHGLEQAIKNIPEFKFIIVGKGATQRLSDAASRWEGKVQFAGFVEDLTPLFSTCCAVILPMVLGTGVKLKALEAMARAVPIVSTSTGVDSIPVNHGKECFIEDDLSKFWVWMEMLTDEKRNKHMSEAAYESFKQTYSREAVYKVYDAAFNF